MLNDLFLRLKYPNEQFLFFKTGILFKVLPNDERNYREARFFVCDGTVYDFEKAEDISSLPVPRAARQDGTGDVTKYLDYIVRMKAGHLYVLQKYELCSICLRKMIELMKESPIWWREEDFYRIVQWNIEIGNFEEAKRAEIDLCHYFDTCPRIISMRKHIASIPGAQKEKDAWREKNKDRKDYYFLFYNFPKYAPKTFAAYRRAKKQNSKKYQEIKKLLHSIPKY